MEVLKHRVPSNELKALRSLNARMNLSLKDRNHYINLEKGYKGEVMFDELTFKLQNDMYIINDLCLEYNSTTFQIDTLIIFEKKIYLFEVKNYEGDYYYESESFKTLSNNEILSPLDQLKRCVCMLRQLLQSLGYPLTIEGSVVFINPEFTLYQSPLKAPIVYPTQLNRLLKKLEETPSKLNLGHKKLADQLISLHQNQSPYSKLPPYEYDQLEKGIICGKCHSFMSFSNEKILVCDCCGGEEDVRQAILRCMEEIKLLFPENKITLNCVFDWCKVIRSKKTIRRILKENYKMMGSKKWAYFE